MRDLLTNWLFLACFSSFATAVLIITSSIVLGGLHTSAIMLVRLLGVFAIVLPIFLYASNQRQLNSQLLFNDRLYLLLVVIVGLSAGLSWCSFYMALEHGRKAGVTDATITAINYSSVALILLINWLAGRQDADYRNLIGVLLIIAGVYLTSLPPSGPTADSKQLPGTVVGKDGS